MRASSAKRAIPPLFLVGIAPPPAGSRFFHETRPRVALLCLRALCKRPYISVMASQLLLYFFQKKATATDQGCQFAGSESPLRDALESSASLAFFA